MRRAPLLLALAACGAPPAPGTSATVTPTTQIGLGTHVQPGRSLRRLDIDQLDATLRAVTGFTWTEEVDASTVRLFDELAGSLGKPDYRSSTDEDLAAGLLFHKFLGDAATSICTALVERERVPGGGERKLLVEASLTDAPALQPERIDANLARLLLLFHGRTVEPGSDAHARWRWLFDGVYEDTGDTAAAWRTVCVGLITHPDFYAQ